MAKCFKCGKDMRSAMRSDDPWEMPSGGLNFDGGDSFGSRLYDALMDGIMVRLLICDTCLEENVDRLQHIKHGVDHLKSTGVKYICDRNGNEIPEQLELSFEEKKDERKESR